MAPDRWQRIEQLYDAALALAPQERTAFLAESCADVDLRSEVESLLFHAENAGEFLCVPEPLHVGQQVSHYRIEEKLGSGGMGEVYRARDSKLGRDVWLKVLPAEFARDAERVVRLKREARVLASLNHPNIAAIYGLEEAEDVCALAMELVEGPTLAARIGKRAMAQEKALPIAKQIVEALEYAHERGIVHRDVKPANVKLTAEGTAKLLDFGLAKTLEGAIGSPAETVEGTRSGAVMGTAAYMSPEQAQGKAVDRRTDIWAFGGGERRSPASRFFRARAQQKFWLRC